MRERGRRGGGGVVGWESGRRGRRERERDRDEWKWRERKRKGRKKARVGRVRAYKGTQEKGREGRWFVMVWRKKKWERTKKGLVVRVIWGGGEREKDEVARSLFSLSACRQ